MKLYGVIIKGCLLSASVFCCGSLHGAVRPISGALFDPPLVPTINKPDLGSASVANRLIVEDASMVAVEIDGFLYSDIEGPTNGVSSAISSSNLYSPLLGSPPADFNEAVTGLTLDGAFNFRTGRVMFASSVTTETDGGFFTADYKGEDDIYIYPLDSSGTRIGTWSIHLVPEDYSTGSILEPHGSQIRVINISGGTGNSELQGAAFELSDFTGGSGVLNNVQGLEFVDESPSYDLIVAGIYRGPARSMLYSAGRAVVMRGATFDAPITDPMTNDFALTGFAEAESITGPSQLYQFDARTDGAVIWPQNGVQPTRTNSLMGLDINGVNSLEYWDFMFDDPVTNAADGFFIVEHRESPDAALVFPLDADRRPISTYAIGLIPNYFQWAPALINWKNVLWSGPAEDYYNDDKGQIGGVLMPLSVFVGGTGGLTEVHGIRICSVKSGVGSKVIDPLVVGSYTASRQPRIVCNVETDPMPTPNVKADRVSTDLHDNDWTLTSITLDTGRYTDLEGPSVVKNLPSAYWWPYEGTPPASAAEAALGLDGAGLVNSENTEWYFDTTVTNGFDGGFFAFEAGADDSYLFQPLGVDSNVIAGYSVRIAKETYNIAPQNFLGISWWYQASSTGTQKHSRQLYGAAFGLNCFTNGVGESLTNDVIGLKLQYITANADIIMAGLYKGPNDPSESGVSLPITASTLTPPLVGSGPYSNDAAVVSIQSDESVSSRIIAPSDVAVYRHRSEGVFFPYNGTNPDPTPGAPYTEGYTNALNGLNINGVVQTYDSEYMFENPVRNPDEGFFFIESMGDDLVVIRPLDVNRNPVSTYTVWINQDMMGTIGGEWNINFNGSAYNYPKGTMIRLSDFAGGTGELGDVYGIRIEDVDGTVDPMVVGQFFGPPDGTMILIK